MAFEHLDHWRRWGVFSEDDFARMAEVEAVSDLMMSMIAGDVSGKSQQRLDALYRDHDDDYDARDEVERRFRAVMEAIDGSVGTSLHGTKLSRSALFFSLFTAIYDHMFDFADVDRIQRKRSLPKGMAKRVSLLNQSLSENDLDEEVADAIDRATSDKGRRDTRHEFFKQELGL